MRPRQMRAMAGRKDLRASVMTCPFRAPAGPTLARDSAAARARIPGNSARSPSRRIVPGSTPWLAIEEEAEGGLDALLLGMPVAHQAPQRVARHGDVVTGLGLSDADHDLEAKRIAVGGAPDLDHGSLTAPRAACRQSSGHPPSAD